MEPNSRDQGPSQTRLDGGGGRKKGEKRSKVGRENGDEERWRGEESCGEREGRARETAVITGNVQEGEGVRKKESIGKKGML